MRPTRGISICRCPPSDDEGVSLATDLPTQTCVYVCVCSVNATKTRRRNDRRCVRTVLDALPLKRCPDRARRGQCTREFDDRLEAGALTYSPPRTLADLSQITRTLSHSITHAHSCISRRKSNARIGGSFPEKGHARAVCVTIKCHA